MVNTKKWYMSKTIWSSGIAFIIAVLTASLGAGSEITLAVIALASAFGLYGRVTAKKTIG